MWGFKRMELGPDCTLVSVQGVGEAIHAIDPNQAPVAWVPAFQSLLMRFGCFNTGGDPPWS